MDFQSLHQKYNIPDDTSSSAIADALGVLERGWRHRFNTADHISKAEVLVLLEEFLGTGRVADWLNSALQVSKEKGKSPIDEGKGKAVAEEDKTEAEDKTKSPAAHLRYTLSKMPIAFRYKLCMVGDTGTGKTSFLSRHLGGMSGKLSINGIDCVYPIDLGTTRGRICFDAFDSVKDSYLIHGDCAIIMFDINSTPSYTRVSYWYRLIRQICGDIPIVVCANKSDVLKRKPKRPVTFPRTYTNVTGAEVSALANCNFHLPFQRLARVLTGDDQLEIDQDSYPLSEPEVPEVVQHGIGDGHTVSLKDKCKRFGDCLDTQLIGSHLQISHSRTRYDVF